MRNRTGIVVTAIVLFIIAVLGVSVIYFGRIADESLIVQSSNHKTEDSVSSTAEETVTTEATTEETTQETTTAFEVASNDRPKFEPVEFQDTSEEVSIEYAGSLVSKNVILVDAVSRNILYFIDDKKQMSPASTTKMMTALTALEYLDPDDTITVGEEINLIGDGSSTAQLSIGNKLTVREVVQGMLLASGNDAAYVLAVNTAREIKGSAYSIDASVKLFVELMNENVKKMELKNTNFTTPDGYDSPNQYSCAIDLAKIAYLAIQNDVVMSAVSKHTLKNKTLGITWTSTNELTNPSGAYYYDKAIGLKTGSTPSAGKCLVSAAEDGKDVMICVVLGSDDEGRWLDSRSLLEYGFSLK